MNTAASDTTRFRIIAREVVADQERVCAVQMKNIEDKLDGVIEDVATVKKDVGLIKTAFIKDINQIKTEVAVLKSRPAIWAAIGAATPVILGFLLWWLSK